MTDLAPSVSVIIATYNWSSVLRFAIQSVLQQTLQDFEVLVTGDHCTDDSEDVVGAFGDPRLRWHNLAENSGSQSAPNNLGLQRARGSIVAYLGHDDLWHSDHLRSIVQLLDGEPVDVGYALGVMIGPPGNDVRILTGLPETMQFAHGIHVPASSVAHRRDLVAAIGGWKDYRTQSLTPDMEFLTRAWNAGKRFAGTSALTVFKFNSGWRRNSYRERRSEEQATYLRRMAEEPDFIARELLAIATSYALNRRPPYADLIPGPDTPPGAIVDELRRRRGLSTLETAPDAAQTPATVGKNGAYDPYATQYFRMEQWAKELHEHVLLKDHYIGNLEAEIKRQHTGRAQEQRVVEGMLQEKDAYIQTLQTEVQRQHTERAAEQALVEQMLSDKDAYAHSLEVEVRRLHDELVVEQAVVQNMVSDKDTYIRSLEAERQRMRDERAAAQLSTPGPHESTEGSGLVPDAVGSARRPGKVRALAPRLQDRARGMVVRLRRVAARARQGR